MMRMGRELRSKRSTVAAGTRMVARGTATKRQKCSPEELQDDSSEEARMKVQNDQDSDSGSVEQIFGRNDAKNTDSGGATKVTKGRRKSAKKPSSIEVDEETQKDAKKLKSVSKKPQEASTGNTKPKASSKEGKIKSKGMASPNSETPKDDGRERCGWCNSTQLYQDYHDLEWGIPVRLKQGLENDLAHKTSIDNKLFEMLCLEGAQAGLSWYTVLVKRERYRELFENFEIDKVAAFEPSKIEAMLNDAGIIRHRGKLQSVVSNAKLTQEVQKTNGSLSTYLWQFAPEDPFSNPDIRQSFTPEAKSMSNALKKKGFKFVGPTICHAFMQAVGMFNDHAPTCFRYKVDRNTEK